MPMIWKLKRLQLETEEMGNRLTYADITDRTRVAATTIARIATGEAKRIDTSTVERLLGLFSQELGRKLTVNDLLEWRSD